MQNIKQHITPEKAMEVLSAAGMVLNIEKASVVVDYLYGLAKKQLSHESNIVHTCEHGRTGRQRI